MIHTTYQGELLVAYDRNSPRHNWRLIVSDYPDNLERVKRVAQNWKDNSRAWRKDNAPEYEQAFVVVDVSDGIIPDNLPRNVQWICPHSTLSGVFQGIYCP